MLIIDVRDDSNNSLFIYFDSPIIFVRAFIFFSTLIFSMSFTASQMESPPSHVRTEFPDAKSSVLLAINQYRYINVIGCSRNIAITIG